MSRAMGTREGHNRKSSAKHKKMAVAVRGDDKGNRERCVWGHGTSCTRAQGAGSPLRARSDSGRGKKSRFNHKDSSTLSTRPLHLSCLSSARPSPHTVPEAEEHAGAYDFSLSTHVVFVTIVKAMVEGFSSARGAMSALGAPGAWAPAAPWNPHLHILSFFKTWNTRCSFYSSRSAWNAGVSGTSGTRLAASPLLPARPRRTPPPTPNPPTHP